MSVGFHQLSFVAFHFSGYGVKAFILQKQSCRKISFKSRKNSFESRKFLRTAVCASSTTGMPAGYPEQWLDEKKQIKQSVAGVDQENLLDHTHLADPDSCFCEFEGTQIHYKVQTHALIEDQTASHKFNKLGFPTILLHGFGASVFSWNQVMKPLAQIIGFKVLAFDRPAFGLTSRNKDHSRPINPYSMAFSILATLYLMNFLGGQKVILIGHSAGSIVAVESYFEAPERVAALILVAPALFAPLFTKNDDAHADNIMREKNNSNPSSLWSSSMRLFKMFSNSFNYISQAIMQLLKGMRNMLGTLYKRFVSFLLRSTIGVALVRTVIDKFAIAAVRNAWYDSSKVTDHVLNAYTKPLRIRGWDRALVEYTAAMLTDSGSESKPPLARRLKEISCPVLIITGDTDRLVPSWNSKRLWKAIPGSYFEEIKNCGHLPQEEKPQDFVEAVQRFLQAAFSHVKDQPVEAEHVPMNESVSFQA